MNKKRSIDLPSDRENVKEISITILGNANSGKSSLVGILTNPVVGEYIDKNGNEAPLPNDVLDNGNGKSRSNILQFHHEKTTGRTSSVSYNYMKLAGGYKIISFVDLAGHESYLKTTIRGVTSSYPDYGFVCIEKSITGITKEHLQLLHVLDIPFGIIMTKIDMIPTDKLKSNIQILFKMMKKIGKKPYLIKHPTDTAVCQNANICPILLLSNKTGFGFHNLLSIIDYIIPNDEKPIPKGFIIDNIYTVQGFGLVVAGIAGIEINKGDDLLLGPMCDDKSSFLKVRVKTLHDDYRNFVDKLEVGKRGCLCIRLDPKYRRNLHSGIVLVKSQDDISLHKEIKVILSIFHHSTTIKPGYTAYLNSGPIKETVKFKEVEKEVVRSGDRIICTLEFTKNSYCIIPNSRFVLREGRTRGYGLFICA
jgi:elongation factor 1-alpha